MFGRKKMQALELRISKLEFIQNYPTKYKVGDCYSNLKHLTVTEITCEPYFLHGFIGENIQAGWQWVYKVYDKKNKRTIKY